ncbi:hypothetical protein B0H13DRAFT_1868143 [Mycena leptocephala]|nr:hypothetical protein B0H13DRAFT_1868143 [Mycena leptocephala]
MRPLAIIVAVYLSATALAVAVAVGRPPLSRVTTSISSLGNRSFGFIPPSRHCPRFLKGLFSAASGLLINLNSALEAMKAHGDFSEEDANVILGEFQKIEPVISAVTDNIGTRTKILLAPEFHPDEIPAAVLQDLRMLVSACQEFQHTLGESVQNHLWESFPVLWKGSPPSFRLLILIIRTGPAPAALHLEA